MADNRLNTDNQEFFQQKLPDRREVDDYFDSFTGHKEKGGVRTRTRSGRSEETSPREEKTQPRRAAARSRSEASRTRSAETSQRREGVRTRTQQRSANVSAKSGSSARNSGSGKSDGNGNGLPIVFIGIVVAAAALLLILGVLLVKKLGGSKAEKETTAAETVVETVEETEPAPVLADILKDAERSAAMYDYDKAIEQVKAVDGYADSEEALAAIKQFEEQKASCTEFDIMDVTHIFFHILDVDPENSFDESKWGKQAGGYNSLMTTIDEFNKMMDEMYAKGYVLVRLHDLAHEEVDENGKKVLVKGSIMLPPGKKAFVMSEDDVCYYEYMKGAGFADKMIIGEDGRPTCHYTDKDGKEFVGNYDVAPLLDAFIDAHPDFSYRGAKACLVFTGYNGVLGYRTDESYDPNSEYYDEKLEKGHDVQAERKEAVKVLRALHEDGFELGSHSWGHLDMGQISWERFQRDCDRWDRNVAPLIEEATGAKPDIIIFPKGADIGDWHPYASDNSRFKYYYDLGFRFFCNVDNTTTWVQKGDTYLRQGRRALDGYNMWRDITGEKNRMSDLFDDVSAIFDKTRPTPVPTY